jgi:uncharacterized protein (TIGR00251 family)
VRPTRADGSRGSRLQKPLRIPVRVKPRARKTQVVGWRQGVLEVSVAALPVDGEANRELVSAVAEHFELPKSAVSIAAGASARHKWIELRGLDPEQVAARMEGRASR